MSHCRSKRRKSRKNKTPNVLFQVLFSNPNSSFTTTKTLRGGFLQPGQKAVAPDDMQERLVSDKQQNTLLMMGTSTSQFNCFWYSILTALQNTDFLNNYEKFNDDDNREAVLYFKTRISRMFQNKKYEWIRQYNESKISAIKYLSLQLDNKIKVDENMDVELIDEQLISLVYETIISDFCFVDNTIFDVLNFLLPYNIMSYRYYPAHDRFFITPYIGGNYRKPLILLANVPARIEDMKFEKEEPNHYEIFILRYSGIQSEIEYDERVFEPDSDLYQNVMHDFNTTRTRLRL